MPGRPAHKNGLIPATWLVRLQSFTGDKWCNYWFGVLPEGIFRVVAAVKS